MWDVPRAWACILCCVVVFRLNYNLKAASLQHQLTAVRSACTAAAHRVQQHLPEFSSTGHHDSTWCNQSIIVAARIPCHGLIPHLHLMILRPPWTRLLHMQQPFADITTQYCLGVLPGNTMFGVYIYGDRYICATEQHEWAVGWDKLQAVLQQIHKCTYASILHQQTLAAYSHRFNVVLFCLVLFICQQRFSVFVLQQNNSLRC